MAQYVQLEAECPVISWNALSVWRLGWGHEWWIGQKVRVNLLELSWALTKDLGTTWTAKGKNLCKSYLSMFFARFELIFKDIEVLSGQISPQKCKMWSAIKCAVFPFKEICVRAFKMYTFWCNTHSWIDTFCFWRVMTIKMTQLICARYILNCQKGASGTCDWRVALWRMSPIALFQKW